MMNSGLEKDDYTDPICPFDTDRYKNDPVIRTVPIERIIAKLDEHLSRNDYESAKSHLRYWLHEAETGHDEAGMLSLYNELMGLYRKTGNKDEALRYAGSALLLLPKLGCEETVAAATTYLNCATVCKAFSLPEKSIELFNKARHIYEKELDPSDAKLAGLYNNMALTLTDLKRYDEALELYEKAIGIMTNNGNGELEQAITYLNIADLYYAEHGPLDSEEKIGECLDKAEALLESRGNEKSGYYAFVCEKCAPVFGHYGRFLYQDILAERARNIYEGN